MWKKKATGSPYPPQLSPTTRALVYHSVMTSPNTRNLIGQSDRLPRGYKSFKALSEHANRCRVSYEQERRAILTSAFEALRLEKPTFWLSPWNIELRGYRGEHGSARL